MKIIWKLSSGTKAETIREEATLELMARAGCRYISISPESGSAKVLGMMDKSFDLDHAVKLIRKMNKLNIRSQACFVLGYPGENEEDRKMTRDLVRKLTIVGADEIALFIVSPLPGSAIFNQLKGYTNYSELTFSPVWRSDYRSLNDFRKRLYRNFFFWKLLYHPLKFMKQPFNFIRRKFETKMEMVLYRVLHTFLLEKFSKGIL
jgi:radical SAM superfamily enzyme YgiQ (UPF0313 family)